MEPIKVNFKDCGRIDLERKFGLEQIETHVLLETWLQQTNNYEIDAFENLFISKLQKQLKYRVDDWNEQELIENFIAPLLTIVNFNTEKYGIFSWRLISAIIGDYNLSGNPDLIIDKGRREPEIPYFCFHEFKKENEPKGDPAGQCLAAMLVAQTLNNNERPIFGIYVVGRHWFFMVLQGNEYAITKAYQAVDEDIYDIVKLLKHLKTIIEEYVKQ